MTSVSDDGADYMAIQKPKGISVSGGVQRTDEVKYEGTKIVEILFKRSEDKTKRSPTGACMRS